MTHIFLVTYFAVLGAEVAGDKLLYTSGALAARYPVTPIVWGLALAFSAKMALAVVAGTALSYLPPRLAAAITAINFLIIAFVLWPRKKARPAERDMRPSRGILVSFAAAFFSEWGDAGQLITATMAMRFGMPVLVWAGAVSAMITKGALAAWLGSGVRAWVQGRLPPQAVRYGPVYVSLLLGLISAIRIVV
jgi:putative Ca2+/H+ antiporter (TMEM165/GDT1 family)